MVKPSCVIPGFPPALLKASDQNRHKMIVSIGQFDLKSLNFIRRQWTKAEIVDHSLSTGSMDGQCTLQLPVCQCKLQFPVCQWDIPGKIIHRSSLIFPPSLWLYKKKYSISTGIAFKAVLLCYGQQAGYANHLLTLSVLFSPLKCLWCL